MKEIQTQRITIPPELADYRLDKALADCFPEYSRSQLKTWIEQGFVTVNAQTKRPRDKIAAGDLIVLQAELEIETTHAAQAIDLCIIYEDEDIIVINKPVGLVVHPAAGNEDGTLLNALLHHAPSLRHIPRGGIVHRIDKDTSGLLVVAKTLQAHQSLVLQLQEHSMGRTYDCIVEGHLISGNTIDAPIGRHPRLRTQRAVISDGKPAVTHYRVHQRFKHHTHLHVTLETGRTHQIRVHMAYIKHPLVGDHVYRGRLRTPKESSEDLKNYLRTFHRQALHASILHLQHPGSGELCEFHAEMPQDLMTLLALLKAS